MYEVNSIEEQFRTNKETAEFLAGDNKEVKSICVETNSGIHEAYDKLDEEHRKLKNILTDTKESLDKNTK